MALTKRLSTMQLPPSKAVTTISTAPKVCAFPLLHLGLSLTADAAYGNEEELGAAIQQAGVPREKLYVVTKTSCRDGETIEQAFSRSLAKLGLDYVDLYLIHNPFWAAGPKDLQAKWAEMEAIRDSGRARSIGVSNYLREHLEPILEVARHPPVVNQIEYHPYLQHKVDGEDLVGYLRSKGIAVEAYAPLSAITRAAPGPCDAVYERLAKKYGVSVTEIGVRWCLDQGMATLTTSSSTERLQNLLSKLPSFKLTPAEVEQLAEAGKGKHYRGFWKAKFAEDDGR
jgi:diketogulonate reductase-like aldo/keto reductase